jgi:hypothetical protein
MLFETSSFFMKQVCLFCLVIVYIITPEWVNDLLKMLV